MGYTPPQLEVRKITGGWSLFPPTLTTGDDIKIYANGTDLYPVIAMEGNAHINLRVNAGDYFRFQSGTVSVIVLSQDVAGNQAIIESAVDAKDLYLKTTGTGVLKFGSYTAGAATDSTGYISIKDAAGNARKLMVQA